MSSSVLENRRLAGRLIVFGLVAFSLFGPRAAVAQYSPDHPKVKAMVQKGIDFLTNNADAKPSLYGNGETILVGYTCYKVTGDIDHPRAKQGLEAAERVARTVAGMPNSGESKIVYEAAMSVLMLSAVDAVKYRPQLDTILNWFAVIQKPHGGFGYLGEPRGDTSQTQYVVLALWTMREAGVEVPPELVVKTVQYLMRSSQRGGWSYKYDLNFSPEGSPTKSLSTAGAGALVVGGDILRLFGERRKESEVDDGLPAAFVRIDLRAKARAERREVSMQRSDIEPYIAQARTVQNTTKFTGGAWYYYWRYSEERYESFLEIVEGKQEKSPAWYNAGVEALASGQDADGSWGTAFMRDTATPVVVDTAFAILYLIRSTQSSIGKLDSGLAFGGYELPSDVSKIRMVGNRIVSDAETSVENLLTMLEDDTDQVQLGLLPEDLQLTSDPVQRREQVARLSRLLSSRDAMARRVAAKLLGRSEDLDQVPELIYALTDPDAYVPMIAEESLRLLSRRLTAGKLKAKPSEAEKLAAVAFWKSWYLGLRPYHSFIDRN